MSNKFQWLLLVIKRNKFVKQTKYFVRLKWKLKKTIHQRIASVEQLKFAEWRSALMLMSCSKMNAVIKQKVWMISIWGLATENDLLSLFSWIWIKSHFQLSNPFVYLRNIAIQSIGWVSNIMKIVMYRNRKQYLIICRSSHPEVFLRKRCSENMQLIYRRTPILKYDFNKVAKQLYWNHILA